MRVTDEEQDRIAGIARQHGFSPDAAAAMLSALMRGHGTQAQFDHPEFGGMGQWSGGGMLMIGDMFNAGLKSRVLALIDDLAAAIPQDGSSEGGRFGGTSGWPADLGAPSSRGSQNGMDYAVFPETRRLAVRRGQQVSLYDTGDHRIGGVSQQQGGGASLTFQSQHGPVSLDSLSPVDLPESASQGTAAPEPVPEAPVPETDAPEADALANAISQTAGGSVPAMIEQLHGLWSRGILTQAEFEAKKADLLSRL